MHWALWDRQSANLVEEFDSEMEGLKGVREILAVNSPDLIDALSLGATYDEGEPQDAELPPALYGERLRARLAELAQEEVTESAHKVHARIRKWLTEEGWQIREVHDPECALNIMVTLDARSNVNIFQRSEHIDRITLSQHCVFGPESLQDIAVLPINILRDTVDDIYRESFMMGVDLSGLTVPSNEMTIRTYVYFDGLTKDTLIQRILLTLRALSLSLRTFARALEKADVPGASSEIDQSLVPPRGEEPGYSIEVGQPNDEFELPPNVVRFHPRRTDATEDGDERSVAAS